MHRQLPCSRDLKFPIGLLRTALVSHGHSGSPFPKKSSHPGLYPSPGRELPYFLFQVSTKGGILHVQWNKTTISSSWVSAANMTATVPATDIASTGSATVTVTNTDQGGGTSSAQIFTVAAAPCHYNLGETRAWTNYSSGHRPPDPAHGSLYVSLPSTDPSAPNTIVAVNPLTGSAGTPVAAGNS